MMPTKALIEALSKYEEDINSHYFAWFIQYELDTVGSQESFQHLRVNLNKKEIITTNEVKDVYSELINIIKNNSGEYNVEVDNIIDIFNTMIAVSNKIRTISRFAYGNTCLISTYLFEKLETLDFLKNDGEGRLQFTELVEIINCKYLDNNEAVIIVNKDKKEHNPIKFSYVDSNMTYSECVRDRTLLVKINLVEKE